MQSTAIRLVRDRHGLRLLQHGVLISDLRTVARPTHGLYDILAALALVATDVPPHSIVLLGFGAGGILAPMKALGWNGDLIAVDTDPSGHELFRRECPAWQERVHWTQADAVDWLGRQRRCFNLLIEDLSISEAGDVEKPEATWNRLPGLIRGRLAPGGVAIFNLLKPSGETWRQGLDAVGDGFPQRRLVHLEDYENRLLVAGGAVPDATNLSVRTRRALRSMGSRQADRFRVETPR